MEKRSETNFVSKRKKPTSGETKEHKEEHEDTPLIPDTCQWGRGRSAFEKKGVKKLGMSLETQETDYLKGYFRKIWGAQEKGCEQKVCVQLSAPNFFSASKKCHKFMKKGPKLIAVLGKDRVTQKDQLWGAQKV